MREHILRKSRNIITGVSVRKSLFYGNSMFFDGKVGDLSGYENGERRKSRSKIYGSDMIYLQMHRMTP